MRSLNLYGETQANNGNCNTGSSVYKLDPGGNYTTLYTFTGSFDGCHPGGGVTLDAAGNLYGTTENGGTYNSGTIFELSTTGGETVLYSFEAVIEPTTGVVFDAMGNLYGTTRVLVYGFDTAGNFSELSTNVGSLISTVTIDSQGNLYGTSGDSVYEIDSSGNLTTLYEFEGLSWGVPSSGVILDSGGNLFGTTSAGGAGGNGVVYKYKLVPTQP
jgi:uncharacterized repeat protein (TIGR03803 family)